MDARTLIEGAELPPQQEPETDTVTITVTGEGALQFRRFMEQLAAKCNGGSSRTLGIVNPQGDDERELAWDFDGDGSTKISVHAASKADR